MEKVINIFRTSTQLDVLEMTIRGIVVFIIALLILRVGGKRTFGRQSPSDNVIMIMLGAVLSRAIIGASPFLPVIVASLGIVLVHRLLTWISFNNRSTGNVIKGKAITLFKDGKENKINMKRTLISHDDLMEGVRLQINSDSLENITEIFIERNGEISVVKKADPEDDQ